MTVAYQRILIAVDATEDADDVLEAATNIDPKGNEGFHVVTVIPPIMDGVSGMGGASFAASWPLQDMEASITKDISDGVRERVARFGIAPDRVAVRFGRPAAEIHAQAEELNADLIVIGSHGRRGFSRVILGSTATGVLHGAPCDVLTVHIND
ncbi:MAG: universal stress protein [Pseudomonadales bacterium]